MVITNRTKRWTVVLARVAIFAICTGFPVGIVIASVAYGVRLDRKTPDSFHMKIVGEVHAGGNISLIQDWQNKTPCIPRYQRNLVRDLDPLKNTETQIITDAPGSDGGPAPNKIFLPREISGGKWFLTEKIQLDNCGPLPGVFSTQTAVGYGLDGQRGVGLMMLPYQNYKDLPR